MGEERALLHSAHVYDAVPGCRIAVLTYLRPTAVSVRALVLSFRERGLWILSWI
jgi:hypothetical protein